MPKVVRSDSKGLIQQTGTGSSGLTSIIEAELVANSDATAYTIASDISKLKVPASSILRNVTVVCTEAAAYNNGTLGIRIGTAANGAEIMALDPDSILSVAAAELAVGKGSSTMTEVQEGLSGAATLDIVDGQGFRSTQTTLYPEVVPSAGGITAGKFRVLVEYMTLGDLTDGHSGV